MHDVLIVIERLASVVYGGTVVCFAALFLAWPSTGRPNAELARVWRAAGPIVGLSMGAWVLGLLGSRWFERGEISWGWSTPYEQLDLLTWLVFGVLWASSFVLEIWTMDPLRSAWDDATSTARDPAAFDAGWRGTRTHLALNALLFVAWAVLAASAVDAGLMKG